jgi:putative DNA primase/helicase
MGEYAGTTGSATICGKTQLDGSAPEPNIIALQHKRLVVCNESGIWARINGERVKELTGGTPISARGLYSKNSITFQPTFKLVLATNHLPNVDDDSHAMWRRIRLIPFTQKFEGADRDERLEEKLKQELQGILAWAVRGAVEYHRVGLQEPQAVMLATLDYRESSDVLADFISERCVLGSEERGTRAALFNAYRAWGEGQGYREKDLLSVGVFGKKLGERFANAKWNGQRVYRGIGVRGEKNVPSPDEPQIQNRDVRDVNQGRSETVLARDFPRENLFQNSEKTSLTSLDITCTCLPECWDETECAEADWPARTDGRQHCGVHCDMPLAVTP